MIEKNDKLALPLPEDTVILVVDDILNNVQIVGSILGDAGYQVLPAIHGEQALRYAMNPAPDLILLDAMMPEMDGFEVCRRLKSNPETSAIPVIFLTAAVDAERVVKGLELGAVDYVSKPFHAAELLARVRTHLELKFSREMLEHTAHKLRELNHEKNEFLGIAAHDLKNPIGNFMGLAQHILSNPGLDRAELKDISEDILKESRRLLQLVTNLLNINAIERGHLKLQLAPCDLVEIAREVIHGFQSRIEAKQQQLALETEHASSRIFADPSITMQVLENLISNALKFSPVGSSIRIGISQTQAGVLCEVQDQGPGLSVEDQKQLFGKFARLSAQPTAGESSTGLGLSIVKKLIQAMNGSVGCESELGHGAKFVVRFPAAP